jgi:hypothetical protein
MPKGVWTPIEERQYRHVLQSELDRGHSQARAESIAAARTNKLRSERGETKEAGRDRLFGHRPKPKPKVKKPQEPTTALKWTPNGTGGFLATDEKGRTWQVGRAQNYIWLWDPSNRALGPYLSYPAAKAVAGRLAAPPPRPT